MLCDHLEGDIKTKCLQEDEQGIRKGYLKGVLKLHLDKGGNTKSFQDFDDCYKKTINDKK